MFKSILTTTLLVAAALPSAAQNSTSRALMAASEERRNAAFLMILKSTGDRCDRVIRTQYNATVGDSDDWEAKCNDGGHYSFSIYADLNRQARVLSCQELVAVGRMLAGPKGTVAGCQMK